MRFDSMTNSPVFAGKPAAAVVSCRRPDTIAAIFARRQNIDINGSPSVATRKWKMVTGGIHPGGGDTQTASGLIRPLYSRPFIYAEQRVRYTFQAECRRACGAGWYSIQTTPSERPSLLIKPRNAATVITSSQTITLITGGYLRHQFQDVRRHYQTYRDIT